MSENDGPEPDLVPDFGDPAHDDLRRLLAGAREDAPMPHDVLARLEATLSGLVAEREDAELDAADDVVVPLRRRPWAPRLLGAAAAVVLIGGVGVGISQMGGSSDDSADKAMSADSGSSVASGSAPLAGAPASSPTPENSSGQVTKSPRAYESDEFSLASLAGDGPLSRFTPARFDQQATRYLTAARNLSLGDFVDQDPPQNTGSVIGGTTNGGGASDNRSPAGAGAPVPNGLAPGAPAPADGADATNRGSWSGIFGKRFTSLRATTSCPGPDPADGAVVLRITFAKKPATLVVHPVVRGTRFVVAWSCDGTRPLAATTVRVPR